MDVLVRPYCSSDRLAVHRIAADTAFFGAPVEIFLGDRQPMLDVFVAYYTDCEPEHIWVAEVAGSVVGYISASLGGFKAFWNQARLVMRALGRLLTGRYHLGRVGWCYLRRAAWALLNEGNLSADRNLYPAHLHINVAEAYRGLGLGNLLLHNCLDQVARLGVPGIHLHTTSLNKAAICLYQKAGFQLLARCQTRLWEPWLPGVEIENLLYGKRLV